MFMIFRPSGHVHDPQKPVFLTLHPPIYSPKYKHQSPNKTTVEYVDDATSSQATQAVEYVPPDGGQIKTEPIRPTDD